MRRKAIAIAATMIFALPLAASAQGLIGGAAQGSRDGDRAAGPVGAVVGGVAGAVGGAVAGLIGADRAPRFREYAIHEHPRGLRYDKPVVVGAVLPARGVAYYPVPSEYGVRNYRYTIVNDAPVLVDPRTRRIVEVIE